METKLEFISVWKEELKRRLYKVSVQVPVSIKEGLWTADCGLRTTDCRLGIKQGLGINCRLRTEYKHRLGIKRGLRTVFIKTALERKN